MIKGLIKIATAIIVIGIMVGILGVVIGGFSFAELRNSFVSDGDYTAVNMTEEVILNSIIIDCEDNIVNVVVSTDSNYNVSYYEAEYYPVSYDVTNSVMTITARRTTRARWFNFSYPSTTVRTMTVEVPLNFAGNINIITANGAISVDNISNVNNIDLRTSNGKLTTTNMIISGDASLRTSNGKILVNDMAIQGALEITTSNGNIDSNRVTAAKVRANNSNGSIDFSNLTSNDIEAITSNGSVNIIVVGIYEDYRIDVATSLGNINVNGLNINNQIINPAASNKVKAKTSNGSIDIDFS